MFAAGRVEGVRSRVDLEIVHGVAMARERVVGLRVSERPDLQDAVARRGAEQPALLIDGDVSDSGAVAREGPSRAGRVTRPDPEHMIGAARDEEVG